MTRDEFRKLVEQARAEHARRFERPADARPDDAEVEAHQEELKSRFPAEYLDFLREWGGGHFGFMVAYSMDRSSKLDVVTKNSVEWLGREDFVAVSDNGAGDYYGFRVEDGTCRPEVVRFDHETGEIGSPRADDWFACAAEHGLQP
jgi:hypothetical protein